ncbi:MAG: SusC/RagA family TonB-linked outer membrane protein [Bacteroidota bacterium]
MKNCLTKKLLLTGSPPEIVNGAHFLRPFFFFLVLLFFSSFAFAQQRTISGRVLDANSIPLPGVTVAVKGKSTSTATNELGVFNITASTGDVLVFSSVGYENKESKLGSENSVNINLAISAVVGSEVIVVGYGTLQRKEVSGSIVSIKTDNIPKSANVSVNNLLQGRAAGLNLNLVSAQPGGRLNVSIRGGGTPLYVIDGVPLFNYRSAEPAIVSFGSAVETGFNGGIDRDPLSSMNPSDIESVDVLKDASATAIYGSAASNGVILITTKKGKSNSAVSTEYRGSYTVHTPKDYFDLLNATEFMQQQVRLARDRAYYLANAAPYGTSATPAFTPLFTQAQIDGAGEGTDWLDVLMRNGSIQEHNIAITSGTDKTRLYTSFNYYNDKAIVENSDFVRFSGRVNLEQKLSNRIRLSVQATMSQINSNNQSTGNGGNSEKFNSLQTAYAFAPYLTIYDANGKYTKTLNTQITNPGAFLIIQDKLRTKRFFVAPNLEIKILNNLKFNLVGGADKTTSDRRFFLPAKAQNYLFPGGLAQLSTQTVQNYSLEGYATYNTSFGDHNISAVGGGGYYKNFDENFSMQGSDFFTDALAFNSIQLATNKDKTLMMSYRSPDIKKYSAFARVNYSFKSKYLLTFNGRLDASSNFAENKKSGFFPGVSGAWRISQEDFMSHSRVITDLKLRVGYGEVGTDPGLNALSLYGTSGGTFLIGNTTFPSVALTQLANPDLSWETIKSTNIGIDYELWKGRINGALDIFRRDRVDIIRQVTLPYANAVTLYNVNQGGSQRSQGIELTVNSINLQGKLHWETSFNIATYSNRWLERSPYDALSAFQHADDRTDIVYGWRTDGIIKSATDKPAYMPNARLGNVIYVNDNKDNALDINDVVVLGYSTPKWSFGLGNRFSFMNFDLDVFAYGKIKQNMANNLAGFYAADRLGIPAGQNTLVDIKNVWTADNPSGTLPGIASNPYAVPTGANSDFYRQDVNYLRLRNITLGYTFNPDSKKIIRSARLFVDVQNVAVWTNYKGYDPEITEGNPYPQTLSTTVGVSVNF